MTAPKTKAPEASAPPAPRPPGIWLDFGGEARHFHLDLHAIRRLQDKCNAGPGEVLQRLSAYVLYDRERREALAANLKPPSIELAMAAGAMGSWRIDDLRETLLQGLIGGGLEPNGAGQLVRQYFDDRPPAETLATAWGVMMAYMFGAESVQN